MHLGLSTIVPFPLQEQTSTPPFMQRKAAPFWHLPSRTPDPNTSVSIWSQKVPAHPASHSHCHASLQWPLTQPGRGTQVWQPGPRQPSLHLQVPGVAQVPCSGLHSAPHCGWSHRRPAQPAAQLHSPGWLQVPCSHPSAGTHVSHVSPCQPARQVQVSGRVQ